MKDISQHDQRHASDHERQTAWECAHGNADRSNPNEFASESWWIAEG
jgi:hypothetical protein